LVGSLLNRYPQASLIRLPEVLIDNRRQALNFLME
jgi:hypothetical protein